MADDDAARLLTWFHAHRGVLHPSLQLQFSEHFGYSFIATDALPADAVACQSPFELACSHLNCLASPPTGVQSFSSSAVSAKLVGRVPSSVVAVFFLAEQRLKGQDSFWYPYIKILPQEADLTTPLYFGTNDLLWLRGTNLFSTTVPEAQTAVELRRSMYRDAWTSGIAALQEDGIDTTVFTWQLYLWAATIFSSRSFTSNIMTAQQTEAESFPLLYPVIDIFNHKAGQQVVWNMDNGSFALTLLEATAAGEQVFNNYAAKGNEELMMGYGFAMPQNPCDHVVLRLAKPPPQVHTALREHLPDHFKAVDWTVGESCFYIRGTSPPVGSYSNPFGLTCLRGIPTELVLALQTMVASAFESSYEDEPHIRAELWWATLDALLLRLQHKLSGILVWNDKLPIAPQNKCQEFAKIYRDGQISILQENIDALTVVLDPLDQGQMDIMDAFGSILPWKK